MNTKEQTCAERIAGELESLQQEAARVAALDSDSDEYQEGIEIYGVRRTETIQLQLSGGGPADYVEITHTEGDILRVEYRFSDWFDTATLPIPEGSPAYEWACSQFEWVRYEGGE